MSGNLDSDRSVTAGKMYPIDLAPQKITIVKSVSNAEVKMAHLISQQPKTTATGQIITHTGSVGLMRPAAQILSPGVSSQPQMIVSGSPILQATQIVSQGSQIIGQNTQLISQPQLIQSGQILSPGTQIISQGSQLSAQVSNSNAASNSVQVCIPSSVSGTQVLSVGGQIVSGSQGLVTGATNVVVSPSVRTLPHSVRVLPPLPHHNTRPAVLSSVNVSNTGGVLVSKGVTSHVPRGLAAGASLAVRPATPTCTSHGISGQGAWSVSGRGRGALVYGTRAATSASPRPTAARQPSPSPAPAAALPLPLATQQQHTTHHTSQLASQLSSQHTPQMTSQHSQQLTSQHIQQLSSQNTPQLSTQHAPQLSTQHAPQLSSQHAPQLASQLTSQHTSQLAQQLSSQHTPQLSSQHTQQLASQHTQQLATQHTSQLTSQHTQQIASQHTPQLASQLSSQLATQLTVQHTSQHAQQHTAHSALVTMPTTTVLTSSVGVSPSRTTGLPLASSTPTVAQRPLPLLQRNFQPAKVVGVAAVGVRGVVGNSAPPQLYYEVPRPAPAHPHRAPYTPLHHHQGAVASPAAPQPEPRPLAPYALHEQQVNIVNAIQTPPEARPPPSSVSIPTTAVLSRPTILRKRDIDESPTKTGVGGGLRGWDGECGGSGSGSGGSTTVSAASSPARDDPDTPLPDTDIEPRKKPRKQTLSNEIRQCHEFHPEEARQSPPVPTIAPPKRPQLSSTYICGWRPTALHFTRPADVKRRETRPRDILAIANQRHVLTSAEGWKIHHLTAQMDDLVSLEMDVGSQLADILRSLEGVSGRAQSALKPHTHALTELLKGNIQRSKIVCEGVQEAREDILRVFTHRNFVADILTRQADKRCFRKHRSQS